MPRNVASAMMTKRPTRNCEASRRRSDTVRRRVASQECVDGRFVAVEHGVARPEGREPAVDEDGHAGRHGSRELEIVRDHDGSVAYPRLHFRDEIGDEVGIGRVEARRGLIVRSEEHTSELQSPCNLVCRLLLEKKKKKNEEAEECHILALTSTCTACCV